MKRSEPLTFLKMNRYSCVDTNMTPISFVIISSSDKGFKVYYSGLKQTTVHSPNLAKEHKYQNKHILGFANKSVLKLRF